METVRHEDIELTVWDIGGQDRIRPLWRHYFRHTKAIIFVVDSNDRDRVVEARDELQRLLKEDELQSAILLVFANKRDLPVIASVVVGLSVNWANHLLVLERHGRRRDHSQT